MVYSERHFIQKKEKYEISIVNKIFAFIMYNIFETKFESTEKDKKMTARDLIDIFCEEDKSSSLDNKHDRDKKSLLRSKNDSAEVNVVEKTENAYLASLQKRLNRDLKDNLVPFLLRPSVLKERSDQPFNGIYDEKRFGISNDFKERLITTKNYLTLYKFDKFTTDKLFNIELINTHIPLHTNNQENINFDQANINSDIINRQNTKKDKDLKDTANYDTNYIAESQNDLIDFNKDLLQIYTDIYDILIKYFYYPENFGTEDKETYIGLYLSNFLEKNRNKADSKYFQRNLRKQKIENFEKEIIDYLYLRDSTMSNNENSESNSITTEGFLIDHHPNDVQEQDKNFFNDNIFDKNKINEKIGQLHRFFSVFNAAFIILLNKYPSFVRRIKRASKSFQLKQIFNKTVQKDPKKEYTREERQHFDDQNDIYAKQRRLYQTEYRFIFIQLFNLNTEIDSDLASEEIKSTFKDKLSYNSYLLKQHNISNKEFTLDIGLGDSNIYENKKKYYFDEDDERNLTWIRPRENEIMVGRIEHPPILIEIWNNFNKNANEDDKFKLFFGFNK